MKQKQILQEAGKILLIFLKGEFVNIWPGPHLKLGYFQSTVLDVIQQGTWEIPSVLCCSAFAQLTIFF